MLCFVFSALVVVLDQLFKRWITITMAVGEQKAIIPGVISLARVENFGAAFSILSGKRWLLAAIMFVAILVIIWILLRYNEGFWGTLGLSAVLGGAVGNLIDRVFSGHVVDMFEFKFIDFAIFNVADIFITLGGITFLIFFIVTSFKPAGAKEDSLSGAQQDAPYDSGDEYDEDEYDDYEDDDEDSDEYYDDEDEDFDVKAAPAAYLRPKPKPGTYKDTPTQYSPFASDSYKPGQAESSQITLEPLHGEDAPSLFSPGTDAVGTTNRTVEARTPAYDLSGITNEKHTETSSLLEELGLLESDLTVEDFSEGSDIDDILREYGFEDDN